MTSATDDRHNAVLIAGAGIAGMAAALHLAEVGHPVHLLDAAPAIGGSMHLLDHTFPTNSCGICLMLPHQPALCPTLECELHDRVRLLPYAEVLAVDSEAEQADAPSSEPPLFQVRVRHKARYVDAAKCTGCGDCAAVCPEARPHDHEGWLAPVKAIYRPPGLRAVPDTWVIDMDYCTRCGECVAACPTAAIDLEMRDREETLEAGALLLTPGFAPFDARLKGEYGYRVYDNVLSALEFERLVSLAGSSVAQLKRPSDGRKPERVAFVHCVGSRDNRSAGSRQVRSTSSRHGSSAGSQHGSSTGSRHGPGGTGYCSSACCMYTAKQVALAKQLDPDLDVTVFFMDLRAFGKDFEAYVDAVRALPGVSYRRAMPSSVRQLQQSRDLLVAYAAEDGSLHEEAFDMVVLALGFSPPRGIQTLARDLGVDLNEYGFAPSAGYQPTRTARDGVFVAGAFREPKDIPETVAEAAGAAAEVAAFLRARQESGKQEIGDSGNRGFGEPVSGSPDSSIPQSTQPHLRDVVDEEPRVGVFVCECDGALREIGPPELAAWAQALPGVSLARAVPAGCSAEGRAAILAALEEEKLNRVVLAGCSHRFYTAEFEALMHDAGLDSRLLARVNLREQVVYPHSDNGAAGSKARSLVGMAVAGLRTMAGLDALSLGARQPLTRQALVAGGGAAGMTAALALARLGIPVHLVERDARLGGQWRQIRYQPDGIDPQAALQDLIARVEAEEAITVHLQAWITGFEGSPGRYRSVISAGEQQTAVDHGVLVVATGGGPATVDEYLYGHDPRVLTQRELEQQIADGTLATARTVVMIQCAGSREPARPYCSRVCCTQAVKNALQLKALRPKMSVYVLYREVRTYGFREAYYQAARDAGVVFVRYELPDAPGGTHKPRVSAQGDGLRVSVSEPVTGLSLTLDADLLVLSVGIEAEEERALASALGVALNRDGFFREEHAKMKPLDLGKGGIYVAGLAHSPRFLDETLAQAQGAAMRAAAFLAPEVLADRPAAVWVNERLCSFCGLCVEACPFEARVMNYDSRVADVDYALCQGCGVCAMVCPNKATQQKAFEHKQLMAAIDMALV